MSLIIKYLKIIGVIILTFVLTVIAQNIALLWHLLYLKSFETILHGITYVGLTFLFIKLLINKGFKEKLSDYRINLPKCKLGYLSVGLLIPIINIIIYCVFIPGHFEITKADTVIEYLEMLFEIIVLGGICAPIAEELTVRGLLMGYIEKKANIIFAIIVTSVLFALVHLFNGGMSGVSLILLVVSGTVAGILYGLTAYKFNSIWPSVFMHMCWNLSDFVHITTHNDDYGVIQYIIKVKNILLTGGAYGNTSSLVAIVLFVIAIILVEKKNVQRINLRD
ncbi:CPBP family intramembrane glutamic endopeptidase [Staphylococcus haemolyticus]|uniref:CPBP family intramembrane glutamic endopeptidase n=1 Tax=Staphylococcus haemolyticus TaxID=1283 RepID=UPI000A109C9E|nr:type II CAAX endopeptidase family protein [Staphylococcus haemolyticus]